MQVKFTYDDSLYRRKIGYLANKVIPYMKVTWEEIADFALSRMRAYTPPPRSGSTNIREMWRLHKIVEGKITEFIVLNIYNNQDVLWFFEHGTKPHEIRPRRAKVLHFMINNEDIFSKLVHHPGTPAYQMKSQTEIEVKIKLEQYITDTMAMVDSMMAQGVT